MLSPHDKWAKFYKSIKDFYCAFFCFLQCIPFINSSFPLTHSAFMDGFWDSVCVLQKLWVSLILFFVFLIKSLCSFIKYRECKSSRTSAVACCSRHVFWQPGLSLAGIWLMHTDCFRISWVMCWATSLLLCNNYVILAICQNCTE